MLCVDRNLLRRNHRVTSILFSLLIAATLPARAQTAPPLNPALIASNWSASWIASPTAPARTPGVFYFRRELMLSTVPSHYWVHVSADNRSKFRTAVDTSHS